MEAVETVTILQWIFKTPSQKNGFTLIELLMVILLLGILGTLSISTIGDSVEETRYDQTLQEMEAIRKALIGDPTLIKEGKRVDFGYHGDVGALPSNGQGLNALLTKPPAASDWSVHPSARIATGWSGPYLVGDGGIDPTTDSWGNAYSYNSTSNPAVIQSLGADGASGGTGFDQDITIEIPDNLLTATVYGFISENGSPYDNVADIDLHFANGSGGLGTTSESITTGDQGEFSFTSVPQGPRSVTVYIPDRTSPTQVLGPVTFIVDRANFIIPTDPLNFNVPGGGGGTPTPPGGGGCTPAGHMSYVPGTGNIYGVGKVRIGFSINVSSAVTLSALNFDTAVETRNLNSLQIGGITRSCPTDYTPCPIPKLTTATFNSPLAVSPGGSVAAVAVFSGNMNSETSLTFTLTHDLGCDVVNINDL